MQKVPRMLRSKEISSGDEYEAAMHSRNLRTRIRKVKVFDNGMTQEEWESLPDEVVVDCQDGASLLMPGYINVTCVYDAIDGKARFVKGLYP